MNLSGPSYKSSYPHFARARHVRNITVTSEIQENTPKTYVLKFANRFIFKFGSWSRSSLSGCFFLSLQKRKAFCCPGKRLLLAVFALVTSTHIRDLLLNRLHLLHSLYSSVMRTNKIINICLMS